MGFQVRDYYTDNGIYTLKDFATELASNCQLIKHSGVVGHHNNGFTENYIKHIVRTACNITIYATLHWTDHNHRELCPLALIHALYLHNKIPSQSSHLTPHEVWSCSKSSFSALINVHPWGCPVYVLKPQLQDG